MSEVHDDGVAERRRSHEEEQEDDHHGHDRKSISAWAGSSRDPRVRRGPTVLVVLTTVTLVAALTALFAWPIPRYLRLSPGPSPDVHALITIEGVQSYENTTPLGLALVVVAPVDTLFDLARASLDDESEVRRRDEVIDPGTSDAENDRRNFELMTGSQE